MIDLADPSVPERIKALVATSHATAVSKKWWPLLPDGRADFSSRPVKELLMLALSELAEALEIYRDGTALTEIWTSGVTEKPEGFPIEIADFSIRIFDNIGACQGEGDVVESWKQCLEAGDLVNLIQMPGNPATWLMDAATWTCEAQMPDADIIADQEVRKMFVSYLLHLIACALQISDLAGFDLWKAIETKARYNSTRPDRHGGKLA